MSDGTRSRTGCITCRIRKKKCDEQRPSCVACRSRQLACYGYAEPAPLWYLSKANWREVQESAEAKALKALAETRYKIRRKVGREAKDSDDGVSPASVTSNSSQNDSLQSYWNMPAVSSYRGTRAGPNTWQLAPDTIWWDSKLQSLVPDPHSPSREETRLLMLYIDVIHPITHTFYLISSSRDRSWLLNRVIGNEAFYRSALSISACFEHSLSQTPRTNEIGICDTVRSLQSAAVRELDAAITRYVTTQDMPIDEFIWEGIRLLDAVLSLLNLEVFSMFAGSWQLHYEASRLILNHVELQHTVATEQGSISPIQTALRGWPPEDERKRSLEFCILNYIWIDVIATTTFGSQTYPACTFDYLSLLEDGSLNIQEVIGCRSWVVAAIIKIVRLEELKHQEDSLEQDIVNKATELSDQLATGLTLLEHDKFPVQEIEESIRLISIIFLHAAQILLQVLLLHDQGPFSIMDQIHVDACLRSLEALPTRLRIRVTWPYTIAGCMSMGEEQHERFRYVLAQTMQERQPPGIAWKGLMVMEECWRLRRISGDQRIGWREAMQSMQAMVLLL